MYVLLSKEFAAECILSEYTNKVLGIFFQGLWWQLLPSLSFLGKTKLGGTSFDPL